jgi:hypothetical protein
MRGYTAFARVSNRCTCQDLTPCPLVEEVNLGVHAPTLEDDADAHLAVHVTR